MLLILGEIRDGKVVITIRDNGVGMDEETLKHILEKKPEPKEKQRKKTSHVGVYNVQNRLQLYYGKEYGLVYESMPGMGTGVFCDHSRRGRGRVMKNKRKIYSWAHYPDPCPCFWSGDHNRKPFQHSQTYPGSLYSQSTG